MRITLEGDSLLEPASFQELPMSPLERRKLPPEQRGTTALRQWRDPLPPEAIPDCDSCPKPELSGANLEAAWLYSIIGSEQNRNDFSGHKMGLKFTSLIAALDRYHERGIILHPEAVERRIRIIDDVAVRMHNERIDARSKRAGKNQSHEGLIGRPAP